MSAVSPEKSSINKKMFLFYFVKKKNGARANKLSLPNRWLMDERRRRKKMLQRFCMFFVGFLSFSLVLFLDIKTNGSWWPSLLYNNDHFEWKKNFFFCFPVFFYSSSSYFVVAWKKKRKKKVFLDLFLFPEFLKRGSPSFQIRNPPTQIKYLKNKK